MLKAKKTVDEFFKKIQNHFHTSNEIRPWRPLSLVRGFRISDTLVERMKINE